MSWLPNWTRRVKFTVDQTDIDAPLTSFPTLLSIGTLSGRLGDNLGFIFSAMQNDANKLKIAVTTNDGTTQCYVEVEKWDTVNNKAILWANIPSINDTVNTDLYLYYDPNVNNNSLYVGTVTSTQGKAVWDSNFVGVYHLGETSGTIIYDSTSNTINGTISGVCTLNATGKIGSGVLFNAGQISFGPNPSAWNVSTITAEAWIWTNYAYSEDGRIITLGTGATYPWLLTHHVTAPAGGLAMAGTLASHATKRSNTIVTSGVWHYGVGQRNLEALYLNAILGTLTVTDSWSLEANAKIGSRGSAKWFRGTIDEVRISNINRSVVWIKASYESERDDLIDWGLEETNFRRSLRRRGG
jgi:hypothetical protein